jgi:spermidine synthase
MRATPLTNETNVALRATVGAAIEVGRVPVIGGFVGATADGHTTTLGRGGSDYSAALVGAGIGAREIQIWTDVDGMLSADPRIVSTPRLVPRLSFAEAAELAYFGAKVLHPSTILPAVEHDIPVRILNSRRPEGAGSVITGTPAPDGTPVTAFACKRDVTVIDITSSRMLMAYGFLRQVFEVFERYRTAVDVVTTGEVSVSVTVDDRRHLDAIVSALIGEQLAAMGLLIRALALPAGGRVLEFGPGYGKLTMELALTGFQVTAVDVWPPFVELIRRQAQKFDVLAIDAFTGDAIPVHLLTSECFRIYRYHLKPDGILAVHVSSRYFELAPVVSLFTVGNMDQGLNVCSALLEIDGTGHTAIIHTADGALVNVRLSSTSGTRGERRTARRCRCRQCAIAAPAPSRL